MTDQPALDWWNALQPAPRARLRRATTPLEALMVGASYDLARRLRRDRNDWQALGTLAATLAHVRTHDPRPTATIFGQMSGTGEGARRRVSELRFRRLIQANDWNERMAALRRAIALVDGRGNVVDLASSLLWWNDRTRADWMFAYFGAAAPETLTSPDKETVG